MRTIQVVFTRRPWNAMSWLIRWAAPRSRFALALASHCMIVDGDHMIEATMLHGVRRVPCSTALKGQYVVRKVDFAVPAPEAGLAWARDQVGQPYDWLGAIGLVIDVDREWQDPSDWFCFELAAGVLAAAGRSMFADQAHISGSMLMAVKP